LKDYAILKLDKAPVNSLNLELLTALAIQLEKFEQSKDLNGIILTSNIPNIFSAGLDIMEMYQCKPERARQFWQTLQEVWIKLYGNICALNINIVKSKCCSILLIF
jgi:3,2-trans-enoyl-CoA isomerase